MEFRAAERKISMSKSEIFFVTALLVVGLLSRIILVEKFQSHWDGPNYSIALINYSFVGETPSPPGYPLYIAIGKLFHIFIDDIHASMLAVSVFFGTIGSVVFYFVGRELFGRKVGVLASLLFLSAPTIYYFGITSNPYGLLPITASLLACIVYRILANKSRNGILLGIVFAFAIGIRPQDALFLLPLFVIGLLHLRLARGLLSFVIFVLLTLIWIFPVAHAVGGIDVYFSYVKNFSQNDARIDLSIGRIMYIMPIILKGLYLTIGIALMSLLYLFVASFYRRSKMLVGVKKAHVVTVVFWLLPSLLFSILVRSDHAAHQMAYLSGFVFVCAYGVAVAFRKHKWLFALACFLIVIFNLNTFFRVRDIGERLPYVSQSYHYSEIVKNNARMPQIIKEVKKYSPGNTIILSDPEISRPVMYHLDKYQVYAYGSLDSSQPHIQSLVHFGKNWSYRKYQSNSLLLDVPKGTENIIILGNNRSYKITGFKYKFILLPHNAQLYIIEAIPGAKYLGEVRSIKRVH